MVVKTLLEGSGEEKWLHVSSFTWRLFLFSVCSVGKSVLFFFRKKKNFYS